MKFIVGNQLWSAKKNYYFRRSIHLMRHSDDKKDADIFLVSYIRCIAQLHIKVSEEYGLGLAVTLNINFR